jgi:hypothetical protein
MAEFGSASLKTPRIISPSLLSFAARFPCRQLMTTLNLSGSIHLKAARELGSAYWSMLARKQLALMKSIRREAHPALSEAKPPGAFLDSLHLMAKGLQEKGVRWREQQAFQKWLEAMDEELADLRGFTPMVRI